MPNSRNNSSEMKQIKTVEKKTFNRSPYKEKTRVMRIPESQVPRVQKWLDECRQDVKDSAWLKE
jgi:hypothetical protein